jgi:gliding motility-associated-like protein
MRIIFTRWFLLFFHTCSGLVFLYNVTSGQGLDQTCISKVSSNTADLLRCVFLLPNSSLGWAVGESGTILKTTDGGLTWSTPLPSKTTIDLFAVQFIDATTGWAVGPDGLLKSTDGGNSWVRQNPPGPYLTNVLFISPSTGWLIGDKGLVMKTTDGGVTWVTYPKYLTYRILRKIQFTDANTGWIIGNNRVIIKTTDGGETWTRMSGDQALEDYWSGYFLDANTGWAVGSYGTISKTSDGGITWKDVQLGLSGSYFNRFNSIYFDSPTQGWAVGNFGMLYKTTDAGASWQRQESGTSSDLYDITIEGIQGNIVGSNGTILSISTRTGIATQPSFGPAVCPGVTVTASVVATGTVIGYQWYKGNEKSPLTNQKTAKLTLTNIHPNDSGSYFVVVIGACNSFTSTTFSLTVNPTPTLAITSTNPCADFPMTLSATSGLTSYSFTRDNGLIRAGPSNMAVVDGLSTATNSYSVTARDANGCSNTASITINALPTPTLTSNENGILTCKTPSLILTATGGNAYTLSDGQRNATGLFTINRPDFYTITVTNPNGCTATASLVVSEARTKPTISISPSSVTLTHTTPVATLTVAGGGSYVWNNGNTSSIQTVNSAGLYSVTVITVEGCSATASASVIALSDPVEIFAPDAFTPNNDGINDLFRLYGEGISSFELVIYNRWGTTVFSTTSLDNYWDGQFQNEPCQSGMYTYSLRYQTRFQSQPTKRTGYVILIR